MAVDTAQTPWVWATTPDGRKVRVPRHLVEQSKNLKLVPSERAKARATEPAKNTSTVKAKEADQ